MGRGVWILVGETFPTQTRAKQGALATASNWLWNFLLAFFTPFITKAIGYRYGFIFACASFFPFFPSSPSSPLPLLPLFPFFPSSPSLVPPSSPPSVALRE